MLTTLRQVSAAAEAEWTAQSAALADEIVAVVDPGTRAAAYAALVARLAATGDSLLPNDDARVRSSFGTSSTPSAPSAVIERHDDQMAAWRARDAASQSAKARLDRQRRWAAWVAVPAVAIGPVGVATLLYGWNASSVMAVLRNAPWLPLVPFGISAAALVGAGVCAALAARAADVWRPVGAAAVAGLVLLGATRSLPVFLAGPVLATDGRSLAGTVMWLRPVPGGVRIEVLGGNGAFQRGEALEYRGTATGHLIRGGR